ncbi:MAG: aminotransferase class I/II-fold pyridoxal phosphate-dependent enzyme [Chitinivibrionales bacterium]|nr:aminotransferase class I/II-fold pyridoxal phosphate-dependent enzyme [Chitinivibrionales bacterium]MBD3358645.1 aminotransferase class I/II-fold pyridoxal phosphate-dependent enzyme [Chitinivibrionales bacterium]
MIEFSSSARGMRSSEIRKLMKLAADPHIISFAGGMPNNDLFPTELIGEIWNRLDTASQQAAFQYCPTAGYPPFLETLKRYLERRGIPTEGNHLLITTGAQQAINLVARVLLDPGDDVVTEYPSFIGALAAFKSFGARLHGIELDREGIQIDRLSSYIDSLPAPPKFLYVSPYFHNPAGIIYSSQRKRELLHQVKERGMVMIEDDPYGELYFDEADKALTLPMKAEGGTETTICYVGSTAKIFGPGMRLGWLLAPPRIIEKCEQAKQSTDACTSTFTQVLAQNYLSGGYLPQYLTMLRETYRRRADIMHEALAATMPPEVSWTKPRGGFYIWVSLPENVDATKVFNESIVGGAAFVIGSAFDPEGRRNNCFRLAFSHTAEQKIAEGISIIAKAVKKILG